MRLPVAGGFSVQAAAVALAAALVLLANLGGPPLWDEDEPKNAGASAAMLATGDWIVPMFNGRLRPEKPPLVNWVQVAGYACLGVNEAGARIGSALLTVGAALLTAATAARLFPHLPLVGLWAGLALGTCVWGAVAGRSATPDAVLGFCTTLAFALAAGGLVPGPGRSGTLTLRRAAAVGAACGAAVLAKGPVGVVLPLAAFGLAAWWQDVAGSSGIRAACHAGLTAARRLRPFVIVGTALAVAGPWYALVTWRTDGAWLREFIGVHNLARAVRPLEGHGGPVWYYLVVLAVGFFPWSIVAAVTAVRAVRGLGRPDEGPAQRLVLAWIAVWVGAFSCAGTKLPGYVWPAYPALALVTAVFLEDWRVARPPALERWMRLAWVILGLAGVGLGAGLVVAAVMVVRGAEWLGLVGLVPTAAAVLAWRAQSRARPGAALGWLAAAGACTVVFLAAVAAWTVGRDVGVRPLVAFGAGDAAHARGTWASFRCTVPSLVFYSGAAARGGSVEMLFRAEAARDFVAAHPDARIVVPAAAVDDLVRVLPPGHGVIARSRMLSGYRELCLVGARVPVSRGARLQASRGARLQACECGLGFEGGFARLEACATACNSHSMQQPRGACTTWVRAPGPRP
ncbi:MAG: ArnT family glycosyltransferase [Planctomycetaceae bacterium]